MDLESWRRFIKKGILGKINEFVIKIFKNKLYYQ